MELYLPVGFTRKTHALAGELKVGVEPNYIEDFLKAEVIFLEIKGKKQPFFIESVRGKGDLILKFEDVDTIEAAMPFMHKEVFLRESDILEDEEREIEQENLEYEYCVGFILVDENIGPLGEILEVIEYPQSEMALIEYKEKEAIVPMIPQFIKSIDLVAKTVTVDLPEGLLDI